MRQALEIIYNKAELFCLATWFIDFIVDIDHYLKEFFVIVILASGAFTAVFKAIRHYKEFKNGYKDG